VNNYNVKYEFVAWDDDEKAGVEQKMIKILAK